MVKSRAHEEGTAGTDSPGSAACVRPSAESRGRSEMAVGKAEVTEAGNSHEPRQGELWFPWPCLRSFPEDGIKENVAPQIEQGARLSLSWEEVGMLDCDIPAPYTMGAPERKMTD